MDSSLIAVVIAKAFNLWTKPLLRLSIENGRPSVELFPGSDRKESIDERIQRIDTARNSLIDALGAMEELKQAAEQNKSELATAIERLNEAHYERASAEKELQAVRGIAQSDIEVFKKLAGVPSRLEIAKERFIGFVLGVTASVLASGVWWGLTKVWPLLKS